MGRWSWSGRSTVEECLSVDIPWLSRHGYFCGFKSGGIEWRNSPGEVTSSIGIQVSMVEGFGGNYVRLQYTHTSSSIGEKAGLDYKVELATTPCNYGGLRYWFICPLAVNGKACRRRVTKLYLAPGGKYFGCRNCYNLTYQSCRESHMYDSLYAMMAKNILGATPDMVRRALGSRSLP